MKVFSIKHLVAVTAVLIAPAFASAAIVVNIASDSRTISGSTQNFALDVTFSNDGAAQNLAGYDAALQISGGSGLTIVGVGTGANKVANPVLPSDPAFASNPPLSLISDAQLSPGTIDNGDGFFRILLEAAPNTSGSFTISFFQDEPNNTSGFDTKLYSNASLAEVPNVTFGTGTVTFSPVPEPATLGLALLGLPLVLRRRR